MRGREIEGDREEKEKEGRTGDRRPFWYFKIKLHKKNRGNVPSRLKDERKVRKAHEQATADGTRKGS